MDPNPKGTVIFTTVGRPYYGFDVFSVKAPFINPPEINEHRLTDGISINFNAQFVNNQDQSIVYISERSGAPRIYLTRPGSPQTEQLPSIPSSLFHDRPVVKNDKLYFVSAHEQPDQPFKSWSALYSTDLKVSKFTRLTPLGIVDYSPSVSYSGKFIAVASYESRPWPGEFHALNTDIVVFQESDLNKRVIVCERGGWPTWSGDSTIYFHRQADDGWWSIFRVTFPENLEDSRFPIVPIRVTPRGVHCFTPAAFHDGKRLAVATRRKNKNYRHIEIYDLESKEFYQVTESLNPNFHHYNPFVSANSEFIGYHRFRGESTQGESTAPHLDAVTSPVKELRMFRLTGSFPAFSPDGGFIVFNHDFDLNAGMNIVKSDGSKRWTLIKDRTTFYNSWSPTEKQVIYTSIGPIFESVRATVQIARVSFDPSNLDDNQEKIPCDIKILTKEETGNNAFPSCSPDGKFLVFRSGRSGHKNLYILDAVNGEFNGGIRQLTDGPWIDTMPSWSPKGDLVAFSSNRHKPDDDSVFSIYVIKPDGSGLRRIHVAGPEGSSDVDKERINHVCFSADGVWLLFTANLGGVTAEPVSWPNQFQPYGDLYVVKLDGSGLRRLTWNGYENGTPAWHPGSELDLGNISYNHLPDGSRPGECPAPPRRRFIVMLLSSLLIVGFLVGLLFFNHKNVWPSPHSGLDIINDVSSSSSLSSQQESQRVRSFMTATSAGVSGKSNRLFGARTASYPWTNNMLSWQRTAFHFQPQKNWMNDPNGPLFYNGWYHLFYQYNPNGAVWGDIVWGHAVSKDLIHWLHLPLAMVADQWYDINGVWTGSATILPDGKLVMLYTGYTNESVQVQNLAYPADPSDPLLLKWVKYSGNPVLVPPPGIGAKDFRDPTTAWMTSEGKWRIAIGSKINRTGITFIYDTTDFIHYEMLHGVLHGVPNTGMWECVDFYPVSTTGTHGLDTSINSPRVKHVVKASMDDDRHDYYAIGTYYEKNVTWIPDNPKIDVGIGIRYDYGLFYASKTFYDQNKKRRVLWGWIGESDSEIADVEKGWASLQGIPKTVVLDTKTGSNLLQWPVEEVKSLRLTSKEFDRIELQPGSVMPLDVGTATQLDIEAEFELDRVALEKTAESNVEFNCSSSGGSAERGALGPFGILVLADDTLSEQTPVYFYIAKGKDGSLKTYFCSDQSRSSKATDVNKSKYGSFVPVLKGEKFTMRILVDHSIIEGFAQGGRTTITSRVYPTKAIYGAARVFLFNNATRTSVTSSLKIWQMNSAFISPYSDDQQHSGAEPKYQLRGRKTNLFLNYFVI